MKNKSYILPFNQLTIRYFFIPVIIVLFGLPGMAQQSFKSGINFGVKIGASRLLTEIPYDFSQTINEFENKAGIAHSLEVSKYLSPRWEIGLEWNFSNLKGNTSSPEFSAEGRQEGLPDEITEPVEYTNRINGPDIFFRYYFKPVNRNLQFNPFIRSGIGILHYQSVFNYIKTGEVIFGTDKYDINLNTPVFILGTGFKTSLSPQIYLVTSFDFNVVPYDFLDVMHNFSNEGDRLKIIGLFAEFKVGIFFNMPLSKSKKSGISRYSATGYMPFASI